MLHTDEKPVEEKDLTSTEGADENTAQETPATKEEKTEIQSSNTDEEEMSLLSDLRRKTDKDIDGSVKAGEFKEAIEEGGSGASSPAAASASKSNLMYMQNHELVAKLCVSCLNVVMGLILQVISDDWSEEGEKKYTLSNTRKNEIIEPLTMVLAQSKNKYNPVVILVITVLISYVPMFIVAFRERKQKNLLKKGKKNYLNKAGEEIKSEKEDFSSDLKRQIAELQSELVEVKSSNTATGEKKGEARVIFKMTEAQKERLKKIKSKKGRRSESDMQFLKDMGLDQLI